MGIAHSRIVHNSRVYFSLVFYFVIMLRFSRILRSSKYHEPSYNVLQAWMNNAEAGDQKAVVSLYAENASLLPTLKNVAKETNADIADYFSFFIPRIVGKVQPNYIGERKLADNAYLYFGQIDFDLDVGKTGARKSFVIQNVEGEGWKIMHHHSSQLPEQ